jgi:hypothetical protein
MLPSVQETSVVQGGGTTRQHIEHTICSHTHFWRNICQRNGSVGCPKAVVKAAASQLCTVGPIGCTYHTTAAHWETQKWDDFSPGCLDVSASLLLRVSRLMRDDLPTLDLPIMANSGIVGFGQEASVTALLTYLDSFIFGFLGGGSRSNVLSPTRCVSPT